jgi:hypothetical protein
MLMNPALMNIILALMVILLEASVSLVRFSAITLAEHPLLEQLTKIMISLQALLLKAT